MVSIEVERNMPRLPRIINSGIDYSDLQRVLHRCNTNNEDWGKVWEEVAIMHEGIGDEALRDGRTISAGEAFHRAAVCFHMAQATNHHDLPWKEALQHRQHAAYRKAMPYLRPPVQAVEVPYKGKSFPGYLRLPENAPHPAPCVLLLAGLDSTKEETVTNENDFLKRGLATFSFDGPGQSLTRIDFPLVPNIEWSVGAILDHLSKRADLDSNRFAIWGRSVGGHTAPRAAAHDPRIKACVSIGGFYDWPWDRFRKESREEFAMVTHAPDMEAAEKIARSFTLEGLMPKVKCPLLIVHSQGDMVCDYEDAERMAREAGGPTQLMLYPEGNHVCDNIPYKVRPLMADWLARQLGLSASW